MITPVCLLHLSLYYIFLNSHTGVLKQHQTKNSLYVVLFRFGDKVKGSNVSLKLQKCNYINIYDI